MKNLAFPLDDSFEMWGEWWRADTPDAKLCGALSYSPHNVTLSVCGSFDNYGLAELRRGLPFEHVHLHGTAEGGQRFTLFDAVNSNRKTIFGGTTHSTWSPRLLIAGAHLPPTETLRLHAVSVTCKNLDAFVNRALFQVDTNDPPNIAVAYKHPDPLSFRVASWKAALNIDSQYVLSERYTSVALDAAACLDILPDEPVSIDWVVECVWRFCDLLTLLTDEPTSPLEIRLSTTPDKRMNAWLLYRRARDSHDRSESPAGLLLFYLAHLIDDCASLVDRWFSASPTLLKAIHMFRNAHRDGGASADRFLNATKAIEAFSRATTISKYIAPDDYDSLQTQLVAAIPSGTNRDLVKSLSDRIKFGNEFSLRRRIKSLIRPLSPTTIALVCKHYQDFADGITNTRNYLTHYSEDEENRPLDGVARYWACEKLLILIRILLLKELGIDEGTIAERLASHPRLSQYIALAKEHPEIAARSTVASEGLTINGSDSEAQATGS